MTRMVWTIRCIASALLILAGLASPVFAQTNDAQYLSDTIRAKMYTGLTYNVTLTVRNTGTTTWTKADQYKLGVHTDPGFSAPGRVELATGESILPGQDKTFSFTMVAPANGTYTIDWQMVRDGVAWFGDTLVKQVTVGYGLTPPDAPTIIWPTHSMVVASNRPDITFTGDPADAYQVHIGSYNTPSSSDGWDSGTVSSAPTADPIWAMSGVLNAQATYYVFVRLHNPNGWGPWSPAGTSFYVDGQLLNDPHLVSGGGLQWWDHVAYNPDRNEYLLAWQNGYTIRWCRLDPTGARIGSETLLVDNLAGYQKAVVCYNSVRHEYLLEYYGWTPAETCELHALRLDATTGNQIGSPIWIANAGLIFEIAAAYSSVDNSYLATWEDYGPGIVRGKRLDSTGVPTGAVTNISEPGRLYSRNQFIAYNPANDEYMVTFQALISEAQGNDAVGQRVRASDGSLVGSNFTIVAGQIPGGIAYDSDMNRYLVVSCLGPWGQFVGPTGTLIGEKFPISSGIGLLFGGMSNVAWNPVAKEYLAAWASWNSSYNFGQRISQTGALIDEPFTINGYVMGFGNWYPTPVYNTVNNEFLIHWYNDYTNIETRRYKTYPVPALDVTAPGPVTSPTATAGDQQVSLSWSNPSVSDFAGTVVRYAIGSYPNSPTDGQLLVDATNVPGTADSFTHTNLNGGTVYYYSVFTYDEVPNYSVVAHVSCTPNGPRTMATSAFNSTADGWSTSVWKSGGLDPGTIGWSSSAGNSGGGMRCTGSGATDNNSRDTREGGEMWKTITTAHFQGIRVSYDLRLSSLGNAYYGVGSGSPTIPVDHNDVQEQLTVFYSTDAGANWTEVSPWLGRDTLLGYLTYGTRQIDLSSIPAVGNNTGFALKFRWQFNAATDMGDLDNIVISGSQMETVQPTIAIISPTNAAHCPSNVTPFAVSGTATDNVGVTAVTWSNNRGGSGTCSLSVPGDRSVYWDGAATLQSGQNLLTFRAYDDAGNVRSTTLMVAYSPGAPVVIGDAKKLADNAPAFLSAKTVTTVLGDNSFYVEEPGQSAGIRVKPYSVLSSVVAGKRVDCSGALKTETNGERYLSGSALVTGDADPLSPVGMTNRMLGGSSWFYNSGTGAGQRGIEGGLGLSNLGMLVTIWGNVTQRDTTGLQYLYVDDGSGLLDGTQTAGVPNVGARVLTNPTSYPTDTFVCVTGVSTCFKDSGNKLRWQVVPIQGGLQTP